MNFCLKSDLKISDNYKLLNSILNIQHYEKLSMFMYSGTDAIYTTFVLYIHFTVYYIIYQNINILIFSCVKKSKELLINNW
jgi:hypothetical protein